MGEALALKYRPRKWSDVIGQKHVQVVLQQMAIQDSVPHALLFEGVRGAGKTTTARILAADLNCEVSPGPCTTCPSCLSVYDANSMSVMELDAASNGNVDDIRKLRELVTYSSSGLRRVILLDEAHSMSKDGQNALLKTLEEPPPGVVFVLLTTERDKIIETIQSRCMPFTFKRIPVSDIVERLQFICHSEDIKVDDSLLFTLAERANGGMRDAIMVLDQMIRVNVRTAEEYAELVGEIDFAPSLLAAMTRNDFAGVYAILDEQMSKTGDARSIIDKIVATLKDILTITSGGVIYKQGEALESRKALCASIDQDRAFLAMQVFWDLSTKVRLGSDARTLLDLAVTMATEKLSKTPRKTAEPPPSKRKLTLDDLKDLDDD